MSKIKDGTLDKLKDTLNELSKQGHYATVMGIDLEKLERFPDDIARLVVIQALANQAALDLFNYYRDQREKCNAGNH